MNKIVIGYQGMGQDVGSYVAESLSTFCLQLRNKVHLWSPKTYQSEFFIRSLELLSKLFYFMEAED
jgi:hypothetical protein